MFIQFLWAKCLLSSGANLAGVKNQDVLGVLATKVACGVPLAQVLPQRCGCSFFFGSFHPCAGQEMWYLVTDWNSNVSPLVHACEWSRAHVPLNGECCSC